MNIDQRVVDGFGDEWQRFDQSDLSDQELLKLFDGYFSIFPFDIVTKDSTGFDLGCGTGRWATLIAPRVKKLHCIDPSSAINVAKKNSEHQGNCIFISQLLMICRFKKVPWILGIPLACFIIFRTLQQR